MNYGPEDSRVDIHTGPGKFPMFGVCQKPRRSASDAPYSGCFEPENAIPGRTA